MTTSRLSNTLSAIDNINKQDPNTTTFNGDTFPKELIYGERMSACLNEYWPDADEYLQIAVRAQHIKRWHLKRDAFDEGKSGYFTWRKELGKFHAELAKSLMLENGYSDDEGETTANIVRKTKLKSNVGSQTLEDVACLVFLIYYFDEFSSKYSEEKIISIVQKTWKKMSDKGHEIALSLTLPEHLAVIVGKALA